MKHQILRSPDDLDGLQSYAVACDDTALGKAPYLAAKNIFFPEQKEVDSIESYIRTYVLGRSAADRERTLSLRYLRHSELEGKSRKPVRGPPRQAALVAHLRLPHVVLLYYNMYVIAKDYPGMVHYLDQAGYLERAYRTAMAFFTIPMELVQLDGL